MTTTTVVTVDDAREIVQLEHPSWGRLDLLVRQYEIALHALEELAAADHNEDDLCRFRASAALALIRGQSK